MDCNSDKVNSLIDKSELVPTMLFLILIVHKLSLILLVELYGGLPYVGWNVFDLLNLDTYLTVVSISVLLLKVPWRTKLICVVGAVLNFGFIRWIEPYLWDHLTRA